MAIEVELEAHVRGSIAGAEVLAICKTGVYICREIELLQAGRGNMTEGVYPEGLAVTDGSVTEVMFSPGADKDTVLTEVIVKADTTWSRGWAEP